MALSDIQENFCREYILDLNATQAAIRAGYAARSATVTASRLLTKANIQERIQQLRAKTVRKLEITHERIAQEYARLAFSDIRNLYNENGALKPITELDDDTAAALGSVEVEELFEGRGGERIQIGHVNKVKMWDKRAALDSLAKFMGLEPPTKLDVKTQNSTTLDVSQLPVEVAKSLLHAITAHPPADSPTEG